MTLTLTLPSVLAAACIATSQPCTSLDSLFVYSGRDLIAAASVRGMEGQAMSLELPINIQRGDRLWVVTSNAAGKSCPAYVVWTTDVPVTAPALRDTSTYDVQGRRVRGKLPRGAYWRKPR